MPRRSAITLDDVASLDTLAAAFWRAARPHRDRAEVQRCAADLDRFLARLREDVLSGRSPDGRWTAFSIRDPKPRQILAPCFRDRVLHHALMAHMGPVLERALVADTFACRAGKGTLAAVRRAQQHVRRFPWFVKIDVRAYFASIDHSILRTVLARRFKDPGLLALCDAILASVPGGPGRGLPIGALTSQYFANSYLDALDRHLLEGLRVRGMVRYMDDVVWWCDSREAAHSTLAAVRDFVARERAIAVKASARIGRSAHGVTFLGFRVLPGALRLSLRRRRRYAVARDWWERRYAAGEIDARQLQAGYDAALAITAHASARAWRRAQLRRRETVDA
jgi:retron-type reverse transcriptase